MGDACDVDDPTDRSLRIQDQGQDSTSTFKLPDKALQEMWRASIRLGANCMPWALSLALSA